MDEVVLNFPRIISVKFTDLIAEIKMENVGISLEKFFADPDVDQVLGRNRVGFVFDMAVQILNALRILH